MIKPADNVSRRRRHRRCHQVNIFNLVAVETAQKGSPLLLLLPTADRTTLTDQEFICLSVAVQQIRSIGWARD